MAWYYGTYSCGHEGRANIIGPVKNREWKKDREFEKMCPDCWEKYLEEEREKSNTEALEKAKEMELPELTGSEKQVTWANTIRQKFIDRFISQEITKEEFKRFVYAYEDFIDIVKNMDNIKVIAYWCIENIVKAHEWIENQGTNMIERHYKEALKTPEEKAKDEIEKQQKKQLEIEATVFPENKITESIAKIRYSSSKVKVYFEKNEDFRQLVKSLGYSWEGVWEKKITETTGTAENRAAELGNKLLNKGFPIMILDEAVRNNAINGTYEPECKRWIGYWKKKDLLYIHWNGYNDELYKTAKSLPGAHWDSGDMVLKVSHYKEAEDFANLYEFRFTTTAIKVIEEYKEQIKKAKTVDPAKVETEKPKDGLQDILDSSSDIIEDLKDD